MKTGFLDLPNFGLLMSEMPTSLLLKIKEESAKENHVLLMTEASAANVTKHYYLKDVNEELFKFIKPLVETYEEEYKYIKSFHQFLSRMNVNFGKPWYSIQKAGEFLPVHRHDGILSYSGWINIPENLKKDIKNTYDSAFELSYSNILGNHFTHRIQIDKSYEGKFILFPSSMNHCVYPHFNKNEDRISISGNIFFT